MNIEKIIRKINITPAPGIEPGSPERPGSPSRWSTIVPHGLIGVNFNSCTFTEFLIPTLFHTSSYFTYA